MHRPPVSVPTAVIAVWNEGRARKIANGFNYPPDYSPWWFDPAEAGNLIKRIAAAAD